MAFRAPQVPPRDARAGLRPSVDAQKGLCRAEEAGRGAQEGQGKGKGRDRRDDRGDDEIEIREVQRRQRLLEPKPPRLRPPRRHGRPPDPRGVCLPCALEEQGGHARLRARRSHDDAPRGGEAAQGEGGEIIATLNLDANGQRFFFSSTSARLRAPPVPARRGGRSRRQSHGRRGRARRGQRGTLGAPRLARPALGQDQLEARDADGRGGPVGGRGQRQRGPPTSSRTLCGSPAPSAR